MEEQSRLEGELRAATAQARFTGLLVVLLPLGGALLAELASPGWSPGLWSSFLTAWLVGIALVLQVAAAVADPPARAGARVSAALAPRRAWRPRSASSALGAAARSEPRRAAVAAPPLLRLARAAAGGRLQPALRPRDLEARIAAAGRPAGLGTARADGREARGVRR